MAIKKIITEPNKLLREISLPVENVGKKEQQLMDDMLDTMYAANGIGLAAIQIGVPKNVVVIDLNKDNKKIPMFFVNPKITSKSKSLTKYEEGCLSIPNLFAEGKGVVAEGKLQDKKFFIADRILAKHDENYMPPELKKIMKEDAK